jgi:hypothetical protein
MLYEPVSKSETNFDAETGHASEYRSGSEFATRKKVLLIVFSAWLSGGVVYLRGGRRTGSYQGRCIAKWLAGTTDAWCKSQVRDSRSARLREAEATQRLFQ